MPGSLHPMVLPSSPLLACPFCGSAPIQAHGKVKCVNPVCKVQPKLVACWTKGYEKEAAAEWNERPESFPTPIEALQVLNGLDP
jgi:uncharacterized Zn finger protein (UPF0148 family)